MRRRYATLTLHCPASTRASLVIAIPSTVLYSVFVTLFSADTVYTTILLLCSVTYVRPRATTVTTTTRWRWVTIRRGSLC